MAKHIINRYTLHVLAIMVKAEFSIMKCYSSLKNFTSIICFTCLSVSFEVNFPVPTCFWQMTLACQECNWGSSGVYPNTELLHYTLLSLLPHNQFLCFCLQYRGYQFPELHKEAYCHLPLPTVEMWMSLLPLNNFPVVWIYFLVSQNLTFLTDNIPWCCRYLHVWY